MMRKYLLPASLLSSLALSACGGSAPQATAPTIYNPQTAGLPPQIANGTSSSLFTFGGKGGGSGGQVTGVQVNAYLWRSTLDTLSFMPLVSADPFGGVIITDWYTPAATPNERFKVNAYILSQQMTANSLQVSVFHQVQQNGQWLDAPVDPSTANGLESRILAHAADLRAASQNSSS